MREHFAAFQRRPAGTPGTPPRFPRCTARREPQAPELPGFGKSGTPGTPGTPRSAPIPREMGLQCEAEPEAIRQAFVAGDATLSGNGYHASGASAFKTQIEPTVTATRSETPPPATPVPTTLPPTVEVSAFPAIFAAQAVAAPTPAVELTWAEYDRVADQLIAAAGPGTNEAGRLAYDKTKGSVLRDGARLVFTRGRI